MKTERCSECGNPLPVADAAEICPVCVLRLGYESDSAARGETLETKPGVAAVPATGTMESDGDRIGRYRLLERIGEGGFGTVWMAEQEEPVRRRVALKILKPGMDTRQVVARFEAERQALALMDHPNIAKVLDGGATPLGRPYFVMELVRGLPITEFCDFERLSTPARLELLITVCQAVQHAHQKGVIHRDLKPSNILVVEQDGRPMAKVIDFGIAKATEAPLTEKTLFTHFRQVLGTPAYMSPEQVSLGALDIDTRSDVYSLGVLLYELLTGRTPFEMRELAKAGLEAMMATIRESEPSSPSDRISTLTVEERTLLARRRQEEPARFGRMVRGELDWIALKALEKDRARRYATANGLAADLRRYLDREPVTAVPPSLVYQLSRMGRRHRRVILTAVAFMAVLVSGAVIASWQAYRASRLASLERLARADTEAQRRMAVTNLARARETLNLYFRMVSEEPKLLEKDLNPLRGRLLEAVVPYYEELAKLDSPDPLVLREQAMAMSSIASLRHDQRRDDDAARAYEQCLKFWADLRLRQPGEPAHAVNMAHMLNNFGNLRFYRLGRPEEAAESFRQAAEIHRELAARYPDRLNYRHDLMKHEVNLAKALVELGRKEEAFRLFEGAIAQREELVREAPGNAEFRAGLAECLILAGQAMASTQDLERVATLARRSVELSEVLTRDFPKETRYLEALAEGFTLLASSEQSRHRPLEAAAAKRREQATHDRLRALGPTYADYHAAFAGATVWLAQEALDRNDLGAARDFLRQAAEACLTARLLEPKNPQHLDQLSEANWLWAEVALRQENAMESLQKVIEVTALAPIEGAKHTPWEAHREVASRALGLADWAATSTTVAESARATTVADYVETARKFLVQSVKLGFADLDGFLADPRFARLAVHWKRTEGARESPKNQDPEPVPQRVEVLENLRPPLATATVHVSDWASLRSWVREEFDGRATLAWLTARPEGEGVSYTPVPGCLTLTGGPGSFRGAAQDFGTHIAGEFCGPTLMRRARGWRFGFVLEDPCPAALANWLDLP